ncbi:KAP family P-loop NTPase fold protein [Flavobacterium branchiicola]|uniref:P-loop NTPase fold protein n=1 Tax=Flavobacterium branchiicola TaxID=1114875 RepID=A0ABV9PBE0_9FLAO|nr:P-loop NTPase fold protein [Flavobacterium branchiicola]MBS7254130.1 AAA family ATPase [Flavobacterium branchiicola]
MKTIYNLTIRKISAIILSGLRLFLSILLKQISKMLFFFKSNSFIIFSWIILVLITILFQGKISSFLAENSVINHQNAKENYFQIAFIISIVIILIRYLWFLIKNYRLARKNNFIVFYLALIYFSFRINNTDSLYFSYLSVKNNLYYADIILLIAFLSLLLFLRNLFFQNGKLYDILSNWFKIDGKEDNFSSFLIEDTPHDKTEVNDNEKLIEVVIKAILNLRPKSSFIIGINSMWGLGKTSFLQRLEYKLQSEQYTNECKPISFWFNAWQHQDEKSIINNFFNQLKTELSEFSGDSKNSIENYLKEMFALVDNKYFNVFKSITEGLFSNVDSIKDSYEEINNIIKKIDRKIIVFVDDIDRLNKAEILETLRILRNIADFKNIIFICGFDRQYVIQQSQIDNYYLDKIFNLEVNLNNQNQKSFIIYLNELIENSLGYNSADKKLLIKAINEIFYNDDEYFDSISDNATQLQIDELERLNIVPSFFFESRRDVKKFFNELYINIRTLEKIDDIDLGDYLELRLLLFKYKWMYKNFSSKRIGSWLGTESKLKFKSTNIESLYIPLETDKRDRIIIYSFLKKMFPNDDIVDDPKRIYVKRYFPIYLKNNVFNESFSFTDLYRAIEEINVEKLIYDKVLNKENEEFIKSDIKYFITNDDNIQDVNQYKQVIYLLKKELLGYSKALEILNIIYLGETKFQIEFEELLDIIFTNSNDAFGRFLSELSFYYSKVPNNVSALNEINFGSYISSRKINALRVLTKSKIKEILFKVLDSDINNDQSRPIDLSIFFNAFYERYYVFFQFGVLLEEFKVIIKQFIDDNFTEIFLENSPSETIKKIDIIRIANIFEDLDEREKIIKQAELYSEDRETWHNYDLNIKDYAIKGLNNFIDYLEKVRESELIITLDSELENFLIYMYTYQSKQFSNAPSGDEIEEFKNKNK